jgi:hypothetical protein
MPNVMPMASTEGTKHEMGMDVDRLLKNGFIRAYRYSAKLHQDGRLAMLQRGARQYLAQSRKGWVGCKTISEPGRAAHKMPTARGNIFV